MDRLSDCPLPFLLQKMSPLKIEGCATGRHSTLDPKEVFAPSPTLAAANQAGANGGSDAPGASSTALKSIEDYNQANPDAATAAKSAASSVTKPQARCTVKADGSATCLNKGCQKEFQVKENHPTACWYVESQSRIFIYHAVPSSLPRAQRIRTASPSLSLSLG